MIENFEEITEDLTEAEMKVLPDVQDALRIGLNNSIHPLKQPYVVLMVNNYLMEKHGLFKPLTLNGVRLRKFINYIRKNSLLPIIATSEGYSISKDAEIIRSQIRSLKQRANSILQAANGLENYLIENL